MGAVPKFVIDFKPTKKQWLAWEHLTDTTTNEVLFGGGAGSAKSFLGCAWLITSALQMPGTRWLMGRYTLKTLKETTLATFFEICNKWGLTSEHYTWNSQAGTITFYNGSVVLLKDLATLPSDPNFDRLGSLEITGAFIDEVAEIDAKAKNIVRTRCRFALKKWDNYGRPTSEMEVVRYHPETGEPDAWRNPEGEITEGRTPKVLMSCNPCKTFPYQEFFKPDRDGTIESDKAFIQALVSDNPYISPEYVKSLQRQDKATRERLLYGNWDYDDNPYALMGFDSICDLFRNDYVEGGRRYMTVDAAGMGSDLFVVMIWDGWRIVEIETLDKNDGKNGVELMKRLQKKWRVPNSQIAYDSDGVGTYLRGYFPGAKNFVNNAPALRKQNFKNLKAQCYFGLADKVNDGEIYITPQAVKDPALRERIIEELEQVQRDPGTDDGKLKLVSKDKVKETLRRSPDLSDCMAFRIIFELTYKPKSQRLRFV